MKKRILLELSVFLIAVFAVIMWIAFGWSQRTYNGKPERYWVGTLATVPSGIVPDLTVEAEWRELDDLSCHPVACLRLLASFYFCNTR
ncbi:MAG: hypothetical protein HY298_07905 [Verrucomicrobia bacterium]|nr:hypothetical protein [Verrucomicrobiota bacterium]